MIKTLILIRHAHRDNSRRELDNGLSEKGRRQARDLRQFMKSRIEKTGWQAKDGILLSSPKKRCVETLVPMAEMMGMKVQLNEELGEQRTAESFNAFDERVQAFLNWWTHKAPFWTLISSHGDWLPVATYHLIGSPIDFKKGAWLELELVGGQAQLRWYVPTFKYFAAR